MKPVTSSAFCQCPIISLKADQYVLFEYGSPVLDKHWKPQESSYQHMSPYLFVLNRLKIKCRCPVSSQQYCSNFKWLNPIWQADADLQDADSLSVQAVVISKKSIAAPDEFSSMDQTFDDIPIPGRQHVPCLLDCEGRF